MARNKFDVDETLESPFQWKHLKRAFQYISRHRFQMLGALGLSVLASICTLYTPPIVLFFIIRTIARIKKKYGL